MSDSTNVLLGVGIVGAVSLIGAAAYLTRKPKQSYQGSFLQGVDLSGSDLSGVSFVQANAAGANFSSSNLTGADLSRSNLSSANFRGARAASADFSRSAADADFQEADLRSANFQDADLSFAKLQGADLRGANMAVAEFRHTNLTGALRNSSDPKIMGWYLDSNSRLQSEEPFAIEAWRKKKEELDRADDVARLRGEPFGFAPRTLRGV